MTPVTILLLAGLLGFAHGQTVRFDSGTGIFQSVGGATPTTTVGTTSSDRSICFDGANILYTNGNQVLRREDNGADTTILSTTDAGHASGGGDVYGLACCCDLVAITYATSTHLRLRIRKNNQALPAFDVELTAITSNFNDDFAIVDCDPHNRVVVVGSTLSVWVYDIDNLAVSPTITGITDGTISSRPTCIARRQLTATTSQVYMTSSNQDYADVLQIDTAPVTHTVTATRFEPRVMDDGAGNPVDVRCVDYDEGGNVYLVVSTNIPSNFHYVLQATTSQIILSSTTDIPALVTVPGSTIDTFVTGLSVCGTTCAGLSCAAGVCTCSPSTCGFCLFGAGAASDECQCENSLDDECVYTGALAATCEQCLAQPDAQLIIYNPLAKRREGTVNVYGVLDGTGTVAVARAVRTGRFGATNWPRPNQAATVTQNAASPVIAGFNAPTPTSLRGSRFGVFLGEFNPTLGTLLDVNIPGIVTENSGFTNALYTTTVNLNSDVTLVSTMSTAKLQPFINTVAWEFTPYDFATETVGAVVTPACAFPAANRLSCTLTGVTRANEGVYDAFRPRRKRRNWHPIFYLFVRQCTADNQYGTDCMATTTCDHGIVDDVCGSCICEPGWGGVECNTRCTSLDQFGSSCTHTCSAAIGALTAADVCRGVLFCRAGRFGCACRSGLNPPECTADCPAGFWGRTCSSTCPAGCPTTCNPGSGLC